MLLITGLAGCGGGEGSKPAPAGSTRVSGRVTYERVLHDLDGPGLDYDRIEVRPVRGVLVEAVGADGPRDVLATALTDADGGYEVSVPTGGALFIRVRARLLGDATQDEPAWDVNVVDNTRNGADWVLEGTSFSSGDQPIVRNLLAPTGWTGESYGEPRAAAPFAILDTIRAAIELVRDAAPGAVFVPLTVNWSPNNVPSSGDKRLGQIGTSHYADGELFILGADGTDTDEYDESIIAHEWGHYFEDRFSRSDTIGGSHQVGEFLDMTVAFGEGFGNALAGMVNRDPIYEDSSGPRNALGFDFDLRRPSGEAVGWYSEASIQTILFGLFGDPVGLGFAPIHAVLTGAQRSTPARTSIFPFASALRDLVPAEQGAIDDLLASHAITASGIDAFATTEENSGGVPDGLPIYETLALDDAPLRLCSTSLHGVENKLGVWRYARFTAPSDGTYVLEIAAEDGSDATAELLLRGEQVAAEEEPPVRSPPGAPDVADEEPARVRLAAGETYVLVLAAEDLAEPDEDQQPGEEETMVEPDPPESPETHCFGVRVAKE